MANDKQNQTTENKPGIFRRAGGKAASILGFTDLKKGFEKQIETISESGDRAKQLAEGYREKLNENKNARVKLSKPFDSRKLDRYRKFSGVLRNEGYKSPKDILFSSLIMILASRIEHLKATDIPNFLENTFHLELSPIEKQFYHSVRQNRNSIGHGKKSFSPTIGDVINTNKFFKSLSKKIDEHIVQHYLELPNFI